MNTKIAVFLFAFFVVLTAHVAGAQQGKVPRIGVLGAHTASIIADRMDALKQGLHELGHGCTEAGVARTRLQRRREHHVRVSLGGGRHEPVSRLCG